MVRKQQLGGLVTSLFISSSGSSSKEVFPWPSTSSSSVWQWPSCGKTRTLSFRQEQEQEQATMKQQAYYKTMNSAYSVDYYSCFPNSLVDDDSPSSTASGGGPVDASSETEDVDISALRSDRLFFEPDASSTSSSCIIELQAASKKKLSKLMMEPAVEQEEEEEDDEDRHPSNNNKKKKLGFGGATAMSVDSRNPYRDFRESMEAVVMSHGGVKKDWRWLEEMLGWYLRANGKSTHGLIVGAFVDLLVSLSSTSPASSSSSPPAACSSSSSSSLL